MPPQCSLSVILNSSSCCCVFHFLVVLVCVFLKVTSLRSLTSAGIARKGNSKAFIQSLCKLVQLWWGGYEACFLSQYGFCQSSVALWQVCTCKAASSFVLPCNLRVFCCTDIRNGEDHHREHQMPWCSVVRDRRDGDSHGPFVEGLWLQLPAVSLYSVPIEQHPCSHPQLPQTSLTMVH